MVSRWLWKRALQYHQCLCKIHTPHQQVHAETQAAAHIAVEDWERNEEMRNNIIHHMSKSEQASEEVMQLVGDMIEECYQEAI